MLSNTYQNVYSSIVSKGTMNSFNDKIPLARTFPLAVMHTPSQIFTFFIFGRVQNNWMVSSQRPLHPTTLRISLIYTNMYFTSQCHYCAEHFVDIELLTDHFCIPSKTSAKTLTFTASVSQYPSYMLEIESLRNPQNIFQRLKD